MHSISLRSNSPLSPPSTPLTSSLHTSSLHTAHLLPPHPAPSPPSTPLISSLHTLLTSSVHTLLTSLDQCRTVPRLLQYNTAMQQTRLPRPVQDYNTAMQQTHLPRPVQDCTRLVVTPRRLIVVRVVRIVEVHKSRTHLHSSLWVDTSLLFRACEEAGDAARHPCGKGGGVDWFFVV